MFQEEQEKQPSFDLFKIAATFNGFLGLTSLTALGIVGGAMVPGLQGPVLTMIGGGMVASAVLALVAPQVSRNPMHFVLSVGSLISLSIGSLLAGSRLFWAWLGTLQYWGMDGYTLFTAICILIIAIVLYSIIEKYRKN